MVAHAASPAGLLGRRQFPGGMVSDLRVADACHHAAVCRAHRRPPAPGGIPARDRFAAPHGARPLTELLCTHFSCNPRKTLPAKSNDCAAVCSAITNSSATA